MTKPIILTALGSMLLSGCFWDAGTTNVAPTGTTAAETPAAQAGPEILAAAAKTFGTVPENLTVTYDSETELVTISDGENSLEMSDVGFSPAPGFTVYNTGNTFAVFGLTSSGAGFASATASNAGDVFGGAVGGAYGRLSDTEMPNSGSATYSGSYQAVLAYETNSDAFDLVRGSIDMTADFDANSISGKITERVGLNEEFADVTLNSADIQAGAFSGTTTGGELLGNQVYSAENGSYSGLFVGANGQEIVGGVMIEQGFFGDDFVEVGAFILESE